jgi:MFS family permease
VTGLILVTLMLAVTFSSFFSGRTMRLVGTRQALAWAMASISLSFVCFGFVSVELAIVLIPVGLALFGIGIGMLIAISNIVVLDAVPDRQAAVATSLIVFVRNLAPPIGVASLMVLFRLWENAHIDKMLDLAGSSIDDKAQADIYGVLSGSEAARAKLLELAPSIADRVDFVINTAFEHAFRNVMFVSLALSVLAILTVFLISGLMRETEIVEEARNTPAAD